jgi:glycosyltransferase involved in cell wall biosynthesis
MKISAGMSRPVRIVFVIYSLGGGGAERATTNLASIFASEGCDVSIVTLSPLVSDAYLLHPSVNRFNLGKAGMSETGEVLAGLRANFERLIALRRTMVELDPDLVIGMMSTANVLAAIASIGLRCAVVGSERTHPPQFPLSSVWSLARRVSYRLLDALVVLTADTAEWASRHTWSRRIVVIPNQVIWPVPATAGGESPDAWVLPDRMLLLAVGRLGVEKGFDLLLEAFSKIAASQPLWDLAIVGEGSCRGALSEQASRLRIADRVVMPGRAGDIAAWYKRASLFVLSSRFEGFPNVLVEAMAYGLPSISFACPTGPSDVIRDGVNGTLVNPGDIEGLAHAMSLLMSDEGARQGLAQDAQLVRSQFAPEEIMPLWKSLVFELVSKSRFNVDKT